MNKFTFFASLFTLFISLTSCDNDDYQPVDDTAEVLNLPAVSFDYENLNLPNHFTIDAPGPLPTAINDIDNTPINNPVTDAGATLGRVLFYDKKLSANGTIACASCHIQEKGFSNHRRIIMIYLNLLLGQMRLPLIAFHEHYLNLYAVL